MTIATTLTKLQTRLQGIASPQALAKVYASPSEAADIGSFPCAVLSLDPAGQHRWSMAASGLARHDYQAVIWLFVGARAQAPLHELHSRCLIWPQPVATALYSGITLDDTVEWVGDGGTGMLSTYTIGPLEWAGRELFGLTFSLPVTEKIPMAMDA
jgi:hypothetical protein